MKNVVKNWVTKDVPKWQLLLGYAIGSISTIVLGWSLAESYNERELRKGARGKYTFATATAVDAYQDGYYNGYNDRMDMKAPCSLDERNVYWTVMKKNGG